AKAVASSAEVGTGASVKVASSNSLTTTTSTAANTSLVAATAGAGLNSVVAPDVLACRKAARTTSPGISRWATTTSPASRRTPTRSAAAKVALAPATTTIVL